MQHLYICLFGEFVVYKLINNNLMVKFRCLYIVGFALTIFTMISCDNNSIQKQVEQFYTDSITIPYKKLSYVGNSQKNSLNDNYKYTMVIYMDSLSCSSCEIKHLNSWNKLLHYEQENIVKFVFIFTPSKENRNLTKNLYMESNFVHGIYIDNYGVFKNLNKNIPDNEMLHCFLLDKDNRIVLVGNPIRNDEMGKLFEKVIHHQYLLNISDRRQ